MLNTVNYDIVGYKNGHIRLKRINQILQSAYPENDSV